MSQAKEEGRCNEISREIRRGEEVSCGFLVLLITFFLLFLYVGNGRLLITWLALGLYMHGPLPNHCPLICISIFNHRCQRLVQNLMLLQGIDPNVWSVGIWNHSWGNDFKYKASFSWMRLLKFVIYLIS